MRKIFLGIIGLFLISSAIYGQEQTLQIAITSDKKVYKVGEEITVTVEVKNTGKSVYRQSAEIADVIPGNLELIVRELKNLEIIDEIGFPVYRSLSSTRKDYHSDKKELVIEPGASYVEKVRLVRDNLLASGYFDSIPAPIVDESPISKIKIFKNSPTFERLTPGQHKLFAKFYNVTSNSITINVVENEAEEQPKK